ncbi:3-hydroxyacyl-CoA dehydrogenase family protein [Catalinimonas niigatensis]|uniref:3-hydroxyacyl-CoA dehydrogenase family protein n=1 Tax=Catalinimonas niigatensis TaxID=1397264 RepID=UPI002666E6B0|nr:3-hydroxyacyl-CoA dehydrogenase NAD-binding domain-containing protein [Catalinimonas niigatensis]WPP50931.1 3-hydroxyacyl-CoA dehydrogenase NAD-binding domain-containing protein [Catalinimonas niigatensis]
MDKICVIGAGTMGNGIAHVFAQHAYQVHLYDLNDNLLSQALTTIESNLERQLKKEIISSEEKQKALQNISVSSHLEKSVKDVSLVIEAATENFEVKKAIFQELDSLCQPDTILATNTSSISITKIASCTQRPAQVIGMHFMNPVPVMKLVEVIKGYATSEEVATSVIKLSKDLNKIPLVVEDYPGFISNRILMPMINEAIYSLYEGVAGVKEIDQITELGMAHPMGPLKLADFIGLDVCLSILKVLQDGFGNPRYAPCPLLVNMVASGNLGVKSKQGFYDYREDKKNPKLAAQFS